MIRSSDPIDVPQLKDMVRAAVARTPERTNPKEHLGGCLYTAPNDDTHHCIAGQVFADANLPVPSSSVLCGVDGLFAHGYAELPQAFTQDAWSMLSRIQRVFDGIDAPWGKGSGEPRVWNNALEICEASW